MPAIKHFPAKILLAGEYTVIGGGPALAIPFSRFQGTWSILDKGLDNRILETYDTLIKARLHLPWIDFNTWYTDIHLGKYFFSSIPEGYGLGSSGALCAGIYERYLADDMIIQHEQLKIRLATLENAFHGKSSGLDPLVSYLQKPIYSSPDGIRVLDTLYFPTEYRLFLLDSYTPRKAEFLIKHFHTLMEENAFAHKVHDQWMPAVEQLLENWLGMGTSTDLWEAYKTISQWQGKYLTQYITGTVMAWWKEGLSTDQYLLKLCGAGGGGYYLGLCRSEDLEHLTLKLPIIPIVHPTLSSL